ncbi:hypothetical protein RB619_09450 [Flavobacterium sp. LHD-80]|uniref:hypothetical protein n=1 Tax=Flavobacterium sp. LHD-80 TaxID=3071411 RepID=UPI0027E137A1|nr:hypothetical protein [Flavobacterium sp. LHD-80]MDQ6470865.1 hypothetical protein [Flavobacterium sp. LHD-80]
MSNITFEDYKNAIKAKYEKEKEEGDYSNNLSSPTTANLRKLCIKRFASNTDKDDLITFESFFDFPFDKDKRNLFGGDELNKLESVKRFFKGKTENPADETIQLAAILVDLRPRPFNKFRKQIDEEDLELINELRITNNSGKEVASNNLNVQEEIEGLNDSKTDDVVEDSQPLQSKEAESVKMPISTFVNISEKPKSKKLRYLAITAILAGLGLIIYLALPHKECMQWSGDHYELVYCDEPIKGNLNEVFPKDNYLLSFRKIKVYDTTNCFRPNKEAFIWYARKSSTEVDFFNGNGNGRSPENGATIKPVTNYILGRYAEKSNSKK